MKSHHNYLLFVSAILIGLVLISCNKKEEKLPAGIGSIDQNLVRKTHYGDTLTPGHLKGVGVETEEMIKQLDVAWATAVIGKDMPQLDLLLADDLIYGHASGVLDTKSSYMEKVGSGRQIYESIVLKNVLVRLLGEDAAVTHSWMHVTGTNPNGLFDDKVMMLHVWTRHVSGWKLVGHQTAKVETFPN